MSDEKDKFDFEGFFQGVELVAKQRELTMKQVGVETGVSASTLSRMAQGRGCDAESLAKLAKWANLDPREFVGALKAEGEEDTFAILSRTLRRDPNITSDARRAIESVFQTTYRSFAKTKAKPAK